MKETRTKKRSNTVILVFILSVLLLPLVMKTKSSPHFQTTISKSMLLPRGSMFFQLTQQANTMFSRVRVWLLHIVQERSPLSSTLENDISGELSQNPRYTHT